MSYFREVVLWHRAAGHPVKPKVGTVEDGGIGWDFVEEEYDELNTARTVGDMVAVADGIADLVWVLCGLAARLGINLDEVWDEVKWSNWDKRPFERDQNGKITKPTDWRPPNIEAALEHPIADEEVCSDE